MWITRVSINNPVFATMVMIGLAVLGMFAYQRLKVEQMPDVSLPFILVLTSYPGASPESVEADVTKPLEYAINTIAGVKLIRSNSVEGQSQIYVEFLRWPWAWARAAKRRRRWVAPSSAG